MKKIFLVLSLLAVAISTTGCQKLTYEFNIDKNGGIEVSETQAINIDVVARQMGGFASGMSKGFGGDAIDSDSVRQQITESYESQKEETKKEMEDEGYTVTDYDDGKYKGLTRSKKYTVNNFGYKSLPQGFSTENRPVVKTQELFARKVYSIDMSYDFSEAAKSLSDKGHGSQDFDEPKIVSENKYIDEETGEEVTETVYENGSTSTVRMTPGSSNYMSGMDMESLSDEEKAVFEAILPVSELVIKIPAKAKSHNATEVLENNAYKWKLAIDKPTKIEIEYQVVDFSILGIILSMVALLLLVVVAHKSINNDW